MHQGCFNLTSLFVVFLKITLFCFSSFLFFVHQNDVSQIISTVIPFQSRKCNVTSHFSTLNDTFLPFLTLTHIHVLVNKTNFVQNLFLVYVSISTCFGRLCAHHQEIQMYLCDTWYLLFCVDDCLVCTLQNNKYQLSHKYSCFS